MVRRRGGECQWRVLLRFGGGKQLAEYEFRMETGARLTAVWRKHREWLRDIRPALILTAPEKHRKRDELEPGQVLIKPGDIRPIAGTSPVPRKRRCNHNSFKHGSQSRRVRQSQSTTLHMCV